MQSLPSNFYKSAGTLAKNPLGVIALFIIMVYAVASIVIGFAEASFFENPYHPSILFLTGFPVVVLGAFVYLVARHHGKLYAPGDYPSPEGFLRTLPPPADLPRTDIAVATSDKTDQPVSKTMEEELNNAYAAWVAFGYCVIHTSEILVARTAPGTGRYRVRVWIESFQPSRRMAEIESVTYRIWDDFRNPILTTTNQKSSFDLWLNVYGEFPLIALVRLRDGTEFQLRRYLELPGRPQD